MSAAKSLKKTFHYLKEKSTGNKAVFHHVPKCGGTSLVTAVRWKYLMSHRHIVGDASVKATMATHPDLEKDIFSLNQEVRLFRRQFLNYLLETENTWVSGHMTFCNVAYENYHDKYKFITVLRDPVERYISEYIHRAHKQGDTYYNTQLKLDEYLESDIGQIQSQAICEYFASSTKKANEINGDDYQAAKSNLAKFDLIGFTDEMATFNTSFNEMLNININVGHKNKSVKSKSETGNIITAEHRQKITKMCQQEIELYDYAKSLSK